MDGGPSVLRFSSISLATDGMHRWYHRRCSSFSTINDNRLSPGSYEEVKKMIILAGVFFMVAILFFLMKLQVPVDEIFKWSPVVWLIGVLLCCLLMNFLCYLRRLHKKRRVQRLRRQQELLFSLNLATSFPCLAPPPHDSRCCGGRGAMLSSDRRRSDTSLPTYTEALATSFPLVKCGATGEQLEETLPPPYDEALRTINY